MEADAETLDAHLRALKRRGTNVLLLDGPGGAEACRRLRGDDSETRRRLYVSTNDHGHATDLSDARRVGVVDVAGERVRSTASAGPAGGTQFAGGSTSAPAAPAPDEAGTVEPVGPGGADRAEADWYSRVPPDAGLSELARHIHVHLERFGAADPAPGEVRVCLDSLDPLVERTDRLSLFRFLHVVTTRVRMADGMGHFHLSPSGDDLRTLIAPLFDATVETRVAGDEPQQRWELREADLTTGWLPL